MSQVLALAAQCKGAQPATSTESQRTIVESQTRCATRSQIARASASGVIEASRAIVACRRKLQYQLSSCGEGTFHVGFQEYSSPLDQSTTSNSGAAARLQGDHRTFTKYCLHYMNIHLFQLKEKTQGKAKALIQSDRRLDSEDHAEQRR